MERETNGQFKKKMSQVKKFIYSVYDHCKKTIVTLYVLSVLFGIYSLPTLIPENKQIYTVASAELATTTPSVMGGDFDYLYASLGELEKKNVKHRLANPKNIEACVEQIEAKVTQDIHILTKTF